MDAFLVFRRRGFAPVCWVLGCLLGICMDVVGGEGGCEKDWLVSFQKGIAKVEGRGARESCFFFISFEMIGIRWKIAWWWWYCRTGR